MANRPLETAVTRRVLISLNNIPGCYAVKIHGGPYGGLHLDIMGCYNGRFFALEVKRDAKGKVTPRQVQKIAQWKAVGGIAGVVWDVDQALELIGAKDKGLRQPDPLEQDGTVGSE